MEIDAVRAPTADWFNCLLNLRVCTCSCFFFFFQAEDGIRDVAVTGVQTCALPILIRPSSRCTVGSCGRCPPARSHGAPAARADRPRGRAPRRGGGRAAAGAAARPPEREGGGWGKRGELGGRRVLKKKKRERNQACV